VGVSHLFKIILLFAMIFRLPQVQCSTRWSSLKEFQQFPYGSDFGEVNATHCRTVACITGFTAICTCEAVGRFKEPLACSNTWPVTQWRTSFQPNSSSLSSSSLLPSTAQGA